MAFQAERVEKPVSPRLEALPAPEQPKGWTPTPQSSVDGALSQWMSANRCKPNLRDSRLFRVLGLRRGKLLHRGLPGLGRHKQLDAANQRVIGYGAGDADWCGLIFGTHVRMGNRSESVSSATQS